jgi:hypothetical protein
MHLRSRFLDPPGRQSVQEGHRDVGNNYIWPGFDGLLEQVLLPLSRTPITVNAFSR